MEQWKLPGAIVVGAPKAGTTTLCDSLARHPDIYMYPKKETHFYNTYYDDRGMAWYSSLFKNAPNDKLVMEGTPDYAMSNYVEQSIPRIHQHNPNTKLIFMVRNPVDRIESHYVQMLSNFREVVDQESALKRWPEIIDSSRYSKIMNQILEHFPREQVHVIFLDDYAADKHAVHKEVCEFLEVSQQKEILDNMELTAPSHRRENQAIDGNVLSLLRKSRHYDKVNMLIPKPIIKLGKKLLRRKINVNSKLSKDTYAQLSNLLDSDWQQFQQSYRQIK